MTKALGLALYSPLAASTRYRLTQYVPALAKYGVDLEVRWLLDDDYLIGKFKGNALSVGNLLRAGLRRFGDLSKRGQYDVVVLYCELYPLLPAFLEKGLLPRRYVYDFDDAFYLKYQMGKLRALKPVLGRKFESLIKGATAVTAGSGVLASYACQFNSATHVLPTVVDVERYTARYREAAPRVTVGWVGSPSTARYLKEIAPALAVLSNDPRVSIHLVGSGPVDLPGVKCRVFEWKEATEVDDVQGFDIGIMPLPDEPWARGKCGFKLIQYMACGLPVVASPVGVNTSIVEHGANGFLANSEAEWLDALNLLVGNEFLRRRLGAAGRKKVEEEYALHVMSEKFADILSSAADSA